MSSFKRPRDDDEEEEEEVVHTDLSLRSTKQQRTLPDITSYSIAWICALHIEMAAARAMLDEVHDDQPRHLNDSNAYILGRIHRHDVVVACLPTAQYGVSNAVNVLTHLIRTFPSIRLGLMVGIGGGVPSRTADIRLGDVVVGTRVMPYDLGKVVENGEIQYTGIQKVPHHLLGTVVSSLRSKHELYGSQVSSILDDKMASHKEYQHPDLPDRLFHATYDHDASILDCDKCDQSQLISRRTRTTTNPVIHYGAIASGNKVMKHGATRDEYARKLHDVICFEMEAAGLMDVLPCLPIRGICDYSDSHKNKQWQRYAAATAAAYARELLSMLPANAPDATLPSETSQPDRDAVQQRRKRLISSLEFDQIDSRKTTIKRAHAKTCQWLLKLPEYEQWLDYEQASAHQGFLWIRGKPGVGKSTIMKFIYQRMKNKDEKSHILTASFFFNARGEYLEKSIIGMYRSLLLQLLQGFPDLQAVLEDYDIIPRNQVDCPSLDILKNLFHSAVLRLGQRSFTCYVDALDECDEQQTFEMVEYFEDLAEAAVEQNVRLRICFSSRHYPFIDIRMGLRLTLEDQQGHVEDLNNYINANLRIKDAALLTELQQELLEKSARVFLWVVLVVDILNRENRRGRLGLRKRLAEVPSGLTDLFKDMLKRDHENMEDLRLCVIWILFAKRPLSPEEYWSAIWAGLSLKGLADDEPPDTTVSDADESIERCVISSSKGLAEITKGNSPVVQFIHESVRDFLIKDNGLYDLWPQLGFDWEGQSHEILKHCCDFYLGLKVFDKATMLPGSIQSYALRRRYSLLEYAVQYVLYHADAASEAVAQDEFLSQVDDFRLRVLHNIVENYEARRYVGGQSNNLTYILADQGLARLIKIWLRHHPSIDVPWPKDEYQLPLFAAMASGNKDAVAAVLSAPSTVFNGCDIMEGVHNRTAFKAMGYKGRSTLTWASEHRKLGFVSWLLQNGTEVDAKDLAGYTALKRASDKGHVDVVKVLLEHGADVNRHLPQNHSSSASIKGTTALVMALKQGHVEVVKVLLDHGAVVSGPDVPLREALGGRQNLFRFGPAAIEMVNLLLDKGASLEPLSPQEREKVMVVATKSDREDLVRSLVSMGVRADRFSAFAGYESPLHVAAANKGSPTLAEYLIENRAKVGRTNKCNETPLSVAVQHNNVPFAKVLLEKKANVNEFCYALPFPGTLLEIACHLGHIDMAILLIEKGANVHVRSTSHSSVIQDLEIRYIELVRIFSLETGKNGFEQKRGHCSLEEAMRMLDEGIILSQTPLSTTPLHIACSRGYTDLASVLLSHGAPVNATTEEGNAPLHEACMKGHIDIVRLLIDHGANGAFSALKMANYLRQTDIVELLIDRYYGGEYPDGIDPELQISI